MQLYTLQWCGWQAAQQDVLLNRGQKCCSWCCYWYQLAASSDPNHKQCVVTFPRTHDGDSTSFPKTVYEHGSLSVFLKRHKQEQLCFTDLFPHCDTCLVRKDKSLKCHSITRRNPRPNGKGRKLVWNNTTNKKKKKRKKAYLSATTYCMCGKFIYTPDTQIKQWPHNNDWKSCK